MADDDWEQKLLHGETSIPIPEIAALKHGHISCRQIRPHLTDGIWDTYFKFAFVRNPYDRFISACYFLNRQNPDFRGNETTAMKQLLQQKAFRQRALILPQCSFVTDENNRIELDYIGRFERLQESYEEICGKIGIPSAALPNKNASRHLHYTNYYDDELREAVTDLYREDLELFGYNWENDYAMNQTGE